MQSMSKSDLDNIKRGIEMKDMETNGCYDNLYKFCRGAFGT
jgi:hypothetical protein